MIVKVALDVKHHLFLIAFDFKYHSKGRFGR